MTRYAKTMREALQEVSRAESNKVNAQLSKILGKIRFTHIYNQKGGIFKLPPNVKHEVTVDRNDMKDAAALLMKDKGDVGFMFKQGQIRLVPAMRVSKKEEADYPHKMYDPKTGKSVVAKTPDDHDKYSKMGYTHTPAKLDEQKVGGYKVDNDVVIRKGNKYHKTVDNIFDKKSDAEAFAKKHDGFIIPQSRGRFLVGLNKFTEETELDEDGHSDVASAMRQCKTITEDATQIDSKLQTMSPEDSLPTWWTNKLAVSSNSMNKLRDYFLVPTTEEVELDESLKGFRVDFGKGMTKGSATYKNKKDAEEFAARRKKLGELPVKITQVTVKNANMFDDPMGPKRKRIPKEEVELDEKFTKKDFRDNEDKNHHTENGVEIVNMFGTSAEKVKMAGIAARHKMNRSISKKDQQDRDALVKKYYPKLKEEVELDEAKLNIKKIHKAVDDGKSMDVIVGMFADKRTTNTDEIRKIVKDYKFKKRMKEELDDEDIPKVKKIIGKLKKASDAHAGQAKDLQKAIDEKGKEMSEKLTDGNLSLKDTVLKMWKEAKNPAQQAAIAIAKKEKEKKEEPDEGNLFGKKLKDARDKGEKTFTIAGKTYDVEKEEKKLDPVNPKAVKKKFADRKDKDIDNDGDVDDTDKFLHKRRKAISKAINKEDVEHQRQRYLETKRGSLRDAVLQMWGEDAHSKKDDEEKKKNLTKEQEHGKKKMTDTGKEMTPVDMKPKMPKIKNEKNKV